MKQTAEAFADTCASDYPLLKAEHVEIGSCIL